MTIHEFLKSATQTLAQAGVASARLDAIVLLEDALDRDRALLLAHPEAIIDHATEVRLNKKIAQRTKHIPLAYIRGKVQFYGRDFVVDHRVLVPRPETEAMISLLKHTHFPPQDSPLHFLDLGSGSGCIGITVLLEIPGSTVELWDIDPDTQIVAAANATTYKVHPTYNKADLLRYPPRDYCDAILANLPYVPDAYAINKAATYEPKLALFAGHDGLSIYRRFWKQLSNFTTIDPPLYVFTEALPEQHQQMVQLAAKAGYTCTASDGLIQQFKR